MNCTRLLLLRIPYHSSSSSSPACFTRFFRTKTTSGTAHYCLISSRRIESSALPLPLSPIAKGRLFSTNQTIRFRNSSTSSSSEQKQDELASQSPAVEPKNDDSEDQQNSSPSSSSSPATEITDNEDEFVTLKLTEEEIDELTHGDEELVRKVKLIQMEHELAKQDGARVPFQKISVQKWRELIDLSSRSRRIKYFHYLWNCQIASENDKVKKLEARAKRKAELQEQTGRDGLPTFEEDPLGLTYALGRNSIFLRFYTTTQNRFYHARVISAMVIGHPLIIDCSYDEHMTLREAKNCAGQLEYLLTDNRHHPREPMNINLCNVDLESKFMKSLLTRIPILLDDNYGLNVTEKSYLDLFPKERLVYLTPHARDELIHYNPDDIYIIGAMVDKTDPRPFSMAKAKREGLRMKKLPLDTYLNWTSGSGKSLTVNQIGNIMIEWYNTKDWETSLQFVPRRKLRNDEDLAAPSDKYYLQAKRKEKRSEVLEDYELVNSRKGFGFKASSTRRMESSSGGGGYGRRDEFRPNLKSIIHDD